MVVRVMVVMLALALLAAVGCSDDDVGAALPPTVDVGAMIAAAALGEEDPTAMPTPTVDAAAGGDTPVVRLDLERPTVEPLPTEPSPTATPALPMVVKVETNRERLRLDGVGQTEVFAVWLVYDNGRRELVRDPVGQKLLFRSSAPLVATVDPLGLISAVSAGHALVEANYEGATVGMAVEVRERVEAVAPAEVYVQTTADVLVAEDGLEPLPPVTMDMVQLIHDTYSGIVVNRLMVVPEEDADLSSLEDDHGVVVLAVLSDEMLILDLGTVDLGSMQDKAVMLAQDERVADIEAVMLVNPG